MGDEKIFNVADLRPGMKGVSCSFIVLDIGEPTKTKEGHTVRSVLVADRTGSISLSVWDEWGEAVRSGDILKLTKGYASLWKGSLTLYIGRTGVLQKVGEFTMVFSDTPNMSERQFDVGVAGSNESQSSGEGQSLFAGRGSLSTDQRHLAHAHHHEVGPRLGPRLGVSLRHPLEGRGGLQPLMAGERFQLGHHRPVGRNHLHGHYSQRPPQSEQSRNNHWS